MRIPWCTSGAVVKGATVTSRRELKSAAGGIHGHLSRPGSGMGTVEVNFLPAAAAVEIIVHDNRRGRWAGDAWERLARLALTPLA